MSEQLSFYEQSAREKFFNDLRARRKEKVICPCCERNAKIWRYSISSTLAVMLVNLYKKGLASPTGFVHLDKFKHRSNSGNNFSILKHWGLVMPQRKKDGTENASGYWCLTHAGVQFVAYGAQIHKFVLVFDDKVKGFEGDMVTLKHCLGSDFNYQELMAA